MELRAAVKASGMVTGSALNPGVLQRFAVLVRRAGSLGSLRRRVHDLTPLPRRGLQRAADRWHVSDEAGIFDLTATTKLAAGFAEVEIALDASGATAPAADLL